MFNLQFEITKLFMDSIRPNNQLIGRTWLQAQATCFVKVQLSNTDLNRSWFNFINTELQLKAPKSGIFTAKNVFKA